MKINSLLMIPVLVLSLGLAACDFNGGVDQGRCVALDENAKTVTLVVDTSLDQHNPHYSGEVITFKLPEDPKDVGPLPTPGGRLQVEVDKKQVLIYDPDTKKIQAIPVEFTEVIKDVTAKDARLKGKKFPEVNKEKGTVTIYSRRLQEIATFKVPEEYMNLPESTWQAGDEVRIAFRNDNKNQAIRMMNVSLTNIFAR